MHDVALHLQHAGADYALAIGQVSDPLPTPGIIRDRTGYSVIAVEQEGEVEMEIPSDLGLAQF